MLELFSAENMKAADEAAIHGRGIGSLVLMERAAGFVASAAMEYMEEHRAVTVLCGAGNNGGDGVAAARLLMERGCSVRAFLLGSREKMTDDTREMERRLVAAGGSLEDYPGDDDLREVLETSDAVVDAIFGIGLKRPLAGEILGAVQTVNASGKPVVAADIPSGVCADTGRILGDGMKAACTVTFSRAKPGHFAEPGCTCCGKLRIEDIGIPADVLKSYPCRTYAVGSGDLRLPVRKPLTHKGDYGKLLILGGSTPYTGAPALCACAAVRGGAGLVYLGVPASIYEIEAVKNREAMPFPLPAGESGRMTADAWESIAERLKSCDVCVIGPGMGRDENTRCITEKLLENAAVPVVADADALWAIAQDVSVLDRAKCPVVLTPHEGEFARLLGCPVTDRLTQAADFAVSHGCCVVLKGHRTVCALPSGKSCILDCGNPGMATGGTGDVLAGLMGAMLCQLSAGTAVVTACWLHGRAGDIAADRLGQYALCAGDIIDALPMAEREIIR